MEEEEKENPLTKLLWMIEFGKIRDYIDLRSGRNTNNTNIDDILPGIVLRF